MIRKALLNGGNAYVNKLAGSWSVDVWDLDGEIAFANGETPEPVYHASYAAKADALADLEQWAPAV